MTADVRGTGLERLKGIVAEVYSPFVLFEVFKARETTVTVRVTLREPFDLHMCTNHVGIRNTALVLTADHEHHERELAALRKPQIIALLYEYALSMVGHEVAETFVHNNHRPFDPHAT